MIKDCLLQASKSKLASVLAVGLFSISTLTACGSDTDNKSEGYDPYAAQPADPEGSRRAADAAAMADHIDDRVCAKLTADYDKGIAKREGSTDADLYELIGNRSLLSVAIYDNEVGSGFICGNFVTAITFSTSAARAQYVKMPHIDNTPVGSTAYTSLHTSWPMPNIFIHNLYVNDPCTVKSLTDTSGEIHIAFDGEFSRDGNKDYEPITKPDLGLYEDAVSHIDKLLAGNEDLQSGCSRLDQSTA